MIPIIGNASSQVVSVGLWISAGWVPFCRSLGPSRFCRPLMNYNALFGSFSKNPLPCRLFPEPGCLPGFLLPFNAVDEEFSNLFTSYFDAGVGIRQFWSYLLIAMFTLIKTAA